MESYDINVGTISDENFRYYLTDDEYSELESIESELSKIAKQINTLHARRDVLVGKVAEAMENFYESDFEPYTPSAAAGDYSPSAPWLAPGMSVSDFI